MITWQTQKRALKDLKPWDQNPRTITAKNFNDLKDSISQDGDWGVIVIDADNTVISGNQRIKALLEQGQTEADVKVPSETLSEAQRRRIALRANKTKGEFDVDVLSGWNRDDLLAGWFDSEEMSKLFAKVIKEDNFDAQREYDSIQEPKAKEGEVYLLGRHRLMCGNSEKAEDLGRLMGQQKARLIFTDPPYNVDYKSPAGLSYHSPKFGGTGGQIFNDNKSDGEALKFYTNVLVNLKQYSTEDCTIYWWFANRNNHINRQAFEDAGWKMSQIIIWLKNSMVFSMGQDYHRCYEPCMVGWKNKKKHYSNKKIGNLKDVSALDYDEFQELPDVWYEHRDNTQEYVHPTQKPVRLAERALRKNSHDGDIVLDVFGGSGSTLIACEQLNRDCYMCELDPKYVDVIIKRYENFTGQQAVKVENV